MMRSFLFLLASWGAWAGVARGGDWPQFRGPTGQGIVPEGRLPLEWSQTKNVVWKRAIPGSGWSSPIVAGGTVYLTTGVLTNEGGLVRISMRAMALAATTGKLRWDKEVFLFSSTEFPPIQEKNSHASPTPVVGDGRLYVHFGHYGTACLDLAGNVLWRNKSLAYASHHGTGSSPILVDNVLIVNCDGNDQQFVGALDALSGKVLWKTHRDAKSTRGFSFSTPLVITVNGRKQVVSPGSDIVAGYDPATGEEFWRVRYQGVSVVPRPVFGNGLIFVCTGYESPRLLAIRPDGAGDVSDSHVAWGANKSVPLTPSSLLIGAELYTLADNGIACCLEAKTGRVHWQERLGGSYSASPVVAGGKIYFLSEDGTGTIVRIGRRFEQLARNELEERTLASPAAANGALYIRTEKHLYRIQEPAP